MRTAPPPPTTRLISVDLPLPGSPETTIRSPRAKPRRLGVRPPLPRRSLTTGPRPVTDLGRGIARCPTPAAAYAPAAALRTVIVLPAPVTPPLPVKCKEMVMPYKWFPRAVGMQ
ncbi:hypothetical protein GCM10009646_44590 [Streptomyces aureus]